jgi:hypothetical protein
MPLRWRTERAIRDNRVTTSSSRPGGDGGRHSIRGGGPGRPEATSAQIRSHPASVRLGELGRREETLAASAEAAEIYRELAARWSDAHHQELEQSLRVAAWLEHGEDHSDAAPAGAYVVITVRYPIFRRRGACRAPNAAV